MRKRHFLLNGAPVLFSSYYSTLHRWMDCRACSFFRFQIESVLQKAFVFSPVSSILLVFWTAQYFVLLTVTLHHIFLKFIWLSKELICFLCDYILNHIIEEQLEFSMCLLLEWMKGSINGSAVHIGCSLKLQNIVFHGFTQTILLIGRLQGIHEGWPCVCGTRSKKN